MGPSWKAILQKRTRAPHAGTNAWLQPLLKIPKLRRGHNYVKIILKITSTTGVGSPFDT